ncbi:MAG TPA: STAS domain-containing protein [Rhodanobacteraceae bacterium]|nr:STAS domain-containing protein [Rhodanobacteraceae bacterium]
MSPVQPALAIERAGDGRVRVAGALGFANAGLALPRAAEFEAGRSATEVDLSGLTDADSATLAVLLAWSARATQRSARLRYSNMPEGLRALARLAEVEPLLGLAAGTQVRAR